MKPNWKQKVKRLNFSYLVLVKELTLAEQESALKFLGIAPGVAQQVTGSDNEIIKRLAGVGLTLFRYDSKEFNQVLSLTRAGQENRAQAMLVVDGIVLPDLPADQQEVQCG